jgi:hypothetical protein
LDEAERLMRRSLELRNRQDKPAELYLQEITKARANGAAIENWPGTIRIESK